MTGVILNTMIVALILLLTVVGGGETAAQPAPQTSDCAEWRACHDLALAARARGDYEAFHDLAWRAVQTGPAKDPALMFLLARAQALSGRPHDSLVMLQRLAALNAPFDATTNEDLSRTRTLEGWPEVEARLTAASAAATGVGARAATDAPLSPTPARTASIKPPGTPPVLRPPPAGLPAASARPPTSASIAPPSTAAGGASVPSVTPVSSTTLPDASETLHFSATRFAFGGVAYDASSHRFVLGDRAGRKLMVVDERSTSTVDLVRADSAGFLDIAAVEIDARRGDLWVASTTASTAAGTLHQLHLGSGRPLRAYPVGNELEPTRLVDLAIAPSGAVLLLDARTPRLWMLRARATSVELVVPIDAPDPVTVAATNDEGIAFVAHRDGRLSRVDLRNKTISRVGLPTGVSLDRLERVRWHRNGLLAVQQDADGTRRILQLQMNGSLASVVKVTRLEVSAPMTEETFVTVSGDDLVLLAHERNDATDASPDAARRTALVVSRVPLH